MQYIKEFRDLSPQKRETQLKMRLLNDELLHIFGVATKEIMPDVFNIIYSKKFKQLSQSEIIDMMQQEKVSGGRDEVLHSDIVDDSKNSGQKAMPLAMKAITKYCYKKGINPKTLTVTYVSTLFKITRGNKIINRDMPHFSQQVFVFIKHKQLGEPDTGRMIDFKKYKR